MKRLLLTIIFSVSIVWANAQAWTQKTFPASAGADGAFAFSINNKIYVGGGINSKQFWQYDPATATWTQKGNLPGIITDRSFGIGFSMDGKGYAGLGIDGAATRKKDFWQYDASTDTWTRMAAYPGSATDGVFYFAINGKAYVGGGEDAFTGAQNNEVYEFDPLANTWTRKGDYPYSGVVYPFTFSIGAKGYVSCGAEGGTPVCKTMEYDAATDQWTAKKDYTGSARLAGVSFIKDGKAWCGMGMDVNDFYASFYSYDAATDNWTTQPVLPTSKRSFGVAAATSSQVFTGLGWSDPTVYRDWWEFGNPTSVVGNDLQSSFYGYPNPANNSLFIHHNEAKPVTVNLIDVTGKKVLENANVSSGDMIDVSKLASGSYYLNFIAKEEKIGSRQVTIIHN